MNVGEAARRSGLPPKTLRHYDAIDLVRPSRTPSGYREYSESDLFRLQLVKQSRGLGFSTEDCRILLSLYDDERRMSREVKAIVGVKLDEISRKLAELTSIKDVLETLADRCAGDDEPDCPILDDLVDETNGLAAGLGRRRASQPVERDTP